LLLTGAVRSSSVIDISSTFPLVAVARDGNSLLRLTLELYALQHISYTQCSI
jgi:hypothetical protein